MTDYIGYEALTQAAMRGVVRETLRQVSGGTTPPGDHHFYISFRTKAPGVKLADNLIERFPDEMTIVIQHQFWDLEIHDTHFEIILKFNGVPQHLSVPFAALTRFVDPAVNFGISFEGTGAETSMGLVSPAKDMPVEQVQAPEESDSDNADTVVNLDAFRRK